MQMKFSDGQCEFSRVFNFAILGYSRNSRKLDARENIVFYSSLLSHTFTHSVVFLKPTVSSRPSAPPSCSYRCRGSGLWL